MAIGSIERIQKGILTGTTERHDKDGTYHCHAFGSNVDPVRLPTLDDVAAYLRANPKAGVRMSPKWQKISKNIFVDGHPL
jgi:hypothetical protein